MRDLAPMERCPVGKRGRHSMMAATSETGDEPRILAVVCCGCGAVRLLDMAMAADPDPLDGMSADEIARRIGARP